MHRFGLMVIVLCAGQGWAQMSDYLERHPRYALLQDSGCSKDTDCKGDRVCNAGLCSEPRVPGRDLGPAPGRADAAQVQARLAQLDQEIAALQDSKPTSVVPTILYVVGTLTSTAGIVVMLFASLLIGIVVSVVGLVILAVGAVVGAVNRTTIEAIDNQIRPLEAERTSLRYRGERATDAPIPVAVF